MVLRRSSVRQIWPLINESSAYKRYVLQPNQANAAAVKTAAIINNLIENRLPAMVGFNGCIT